MSILDSEDGQIALFIKAIARTKSLGDVRYTLIDFLDDPEQKITWPEVLTFRQLAARIVEEKKKSLEVLATDKNINDDIGRIGRFIAVAREKSATADAHLTQLTDNYPYALQLSQNIDKLIIEDKDVFEAFTAKEKAAGVTKNLEQIAIGLMGTPNTSKR